MPTVIPSGVPNGTLPYGYHILDFSERLTNSGAEVSVVYEGPSAYRHNFIYTIFPAWVYGNSYTGNLCCVQLHSTPKPYPDLAMLVTYLDDLPQNGDPCPYVTNISPIYTHPQLTWSCLWPDTFTIERGDALCSVDRVSCSTIISPGESIGGAPVSRDVLRPMEAELAKPLYYSNGSGVQCSCRITINYRRKYHGSWPVFMYPCAEDAADWKPPAIPLGTYTECSYNPEIKGKITDEEKLVYDPKRIFNRLNPSSALATSCPNPFKVDASEDGEAGWCNDTKPDKPLVDTKYTASQIVSAQELEVRWLGVPRINFGVLRSLEGWVNDRVWFGHPPESVLFSAYEIQQVPQFGCMDLYNVILKFSILTSPVYLIGVATESDMVVAGKSAWPTRGVYKGRVGLWNRIWSPDPMWIGKGTNDSDKIYGTNWVPVEKQQSSMCGVSLGEPDGYGRSIYPSGCLDNLFKFNEVGCGSSLPPSISTGQPTVTIDPILTENPAP